LVYVTLQRDIEAYAT